MLDADDYDDELDDLMLERKFALRMHNALMRHPDPRDPDHPYQDDCDEE